MAKNLAKANNNNVDGSAKPSDAFPAVEWMGGVKDFVEKERVG